jgi:hypothetical protein
MIYFAFDSFCGDRFPMTIISEENQIGLTFQNSLRQFGRGFFATVKLLERMYRVHVCATST